MTNEPSCLCDRPRDPRDLLECEENLLTLAGWSLCRRWGLRGWPIEEVASEFGCAPRELPLCAWEEHEAGFALYLEQE